MTSRISVDNEGAVIQADTQELSFTGGGITAEVDEGNPRRVNVSLSALVGGVYWQRPWNGGPTSMVTPTGGAVYRQQIDQIGVTGGQDDGYDYSFSIDIDGVTTVISHIKTTGETVAQIRDALVEAVVAAGLGMSAQVNASATFELISLDASLPFTVVALAVAVVPATTIPYGTYASPSAIPSGAGNNNTTFFWDILDGLAALSSAVTGVEPLVAPVGRYRIRGTGGSNSSSPWLIASANTRYDPVTADLGWFTLPFDVASGSTYAAFDVITDAYGRVKLHVYTSGGTLVPSFGDLVVESR